MNIKGESFRAYEYLLFALAAIAALVVCICLGSVNVPLKDTIQVFRRAILGLDMPKELPSSIILTVRLPRVLCVALTGASLALSGAAMQGLLKNPLADGSTLGVSSGASLGAVVAIAFGISFKAVPFAGTTIMAVLFAFLSLLIILALAYRLDFSLSTNTIILIGVIYSMFVSSAMSILITFSSSKLHQITFWTMGSLNGSTYLNALVLFAAFAVFGGVLLRTQGSLTRSPLARIMRAAWALT